MLFSIDWYSNSPTGILCDTSRTKRELKNFEKLLSSIETSNLMRTGGVTAITSGFFEDFG